MQDILGEEWIIASAGGSTGEAYYAQNENKRLFLKRNSSPFLAVLSAQGIVPKLVWTKRLENGDVITAQEWLEGKELNPEEMQHPTVANLLSTIHHSTELLDMLTRMGKKPIDPAMMYNTLSREMSKVTQKVMPMIIHQTLAYLDDNIEHLFNVKKMVCHCDLNHNNWLVSDVGQLYLIDWDNAQIGDPALDLGMLLHWYIPESDWDQWLDNYGITNDNNLFIRMHWYMMIELLKAYIDNQKNNKVLEAAKQLDELERLLNRAINYMK
nr:phosphotransferase family protein [Paraliobacillus sp. PM-2]